MGAIAIMTAIALKAEIFATSRTQAILTFCSSIMVEEGLK